MAQHGCHAALPQGLLHARTGVAELGRLQQGLPHPKTLATQGIQVYAGGYDIASQGTGINVMPLGLNLGAAGACRLGVGLLETGVW